MDYLEAKINQLVIERPREGKTFVRSFATRPPRSLAGKLGKIFGLIEIESVHPKIPDLIDFIIDEIKNNYYHQKNSEVESETYALSDQFESALKKTNLAIASFIESEQISIDLEKINIIIAVIINRDLHFTTVGNMGAILFYSVARNNYRIVNIVETMQSPTAVANPLKLFSQVISGKIRPRDVLFVTTANILDYFSLEKIKNILTGQLPDEGALELKKLLEEINEKENFGILILELEKLTIPVKKPVDIQTFDYRRAASKDSIKELLRTEKETEKLLTPSILPEIKKYAKSFTTAFQNYLEKVKSSTVTIYQKRKIIIPSGLINIKFKPPVNLRPTISLKPKIKKFGKIGNTAKNMIQPIWQLAKKMITVIAGLPLWSKASLISRQIFNNLSLRFKRLPKSSQTLLIIAVILAILFSSSVIWLGIKNRREAKIEQFNQIVLEAETKKNDAESSLIYRDEGKARELLIEARNLITALKPTSETQQDQISMLAAEIEEQLTNLRHSIEVNNPVQIVNFANLDSQADIAKLIVNIGKVVYTQNYNNQSIYKANLNTRIMSAIYSPVVNTGNLDLGVAVSSNELIFFNGSRSAFRLYPNNDNIENIAININGNADIVDVATYNSWIYLLDAANGQVYRYAKTAAGYGNASNWIQEGGVDLSNAVSFIIDGSIYILKTDGQILKLQNGKSVDWRTTTIDPKLESPTKIKTNDLSSYLYILDPPTKRLIVLDKEGNLINQYVSESFNNLKDFIVIENERQIYILNGSVIFGIPAEHLE